MERPRDISFLERADCGGPRTYRVEVGKFGIRSVIVVFAETAPTDSNDGGQGI